MTELLRNMPSALLVTTSPSSTALAGSSCSSCAMGGEPLREVMSVATVDNHARAQLVDLHAIVWAGPLHLRKLPGIAALPSKMKECHLLT